MRKETVLTNRKSSPWRYGNSFLFRDNMKRTVTIPVKTVNILNVREHWAKRAKRAKDHRRDAWLACVAAWTDHEMRFPMTVVLRRIAPRLLDDGDNLSASMKSVRDGVAQAIGVDDGSPLVKWKYEQRRGKVREYAVEVEIL